MKKTISQVCLQPRQILDTGLSVLQLGVFVSLLAYLCDQPECRAEMETAISALSHLLAQPDGDIRGALEEAIARGLVSEAEGDISIPLLSVQYRRAVSKRGKNLAHKKGTRVEREEGVFRGENSKGLPVEDLGLTFDTTERFSAMKTLEAGEVFSDENSMNRPGLEPEILKPSSSGAFKFSEMEGGGFSAVKTQEEESLVEVFSSENSEALTGQDYGFIGESAQEFSEVKTQNCSPLRLETESKTLSVKSSGQSPRGCALDLGILIYISRSLSINNLLLDLDLLEELDLQEEKKNAEKEKKDPEPDSLPSAEDPSPVKIELFDPTLILPPPPPPAPPAPQNGTEKAGVEVETIESSSDTPNTTSCPQNAGENKRKRKASTPTSTSRSQPAKSKHLPDEAETLYGGWQRMMKSYRPEAGYDRKAFMAGLDGAVERGEDPAVLVSATQHYIDRYNEAFLAQRNLSMPPDAERFFKGKNGGDPYYVKEWRLMQDTTPVVSQEEAILSSLRSRQRFEKFWAWICNQYQQPVLARDGLQPSPGKKLDAAISWKNHLERPEWSDEEVDRQIGIMSRTVGQSSWLKSQRCLSTAANLISNEQWKVAGLQPTATWTAQAPSATAQVLTWKPMEEFKASKIASTPQDLDTLKKTVHESLLAMGVRADDPTMKAWAQGIAPYADKRSYANEKHYSNLAYAFWEPWVLPKLAFDLGLAA